ncbi:MAG TPA: hypothetical protein VKH37_00070, partial [Ferruginibacter sp.]|nr:hypothetical protein [Ferruginibacter sp.]
DCLRYGMQLKFIPRQEYANKEIASFLDELNSEFGEFLLIPEGGYDPLGAKGAALIMDLVSDNNYTHIVSATGTATTLAGLLLGSKNDQKIIGVNVLKGISDTFQRLNYLCVTEVKPEKVLILDEYHFGGYAKYNAELIAFMNDCWASFQLPLDFVYTAKMLYGIFGEIRKGNIAKGSKILCLHTGGLAGNRSLTTGTLSY